MKLLTRMKIAVVAAACALATSLSAASYSLTIDGSGCLTGYTGTLPEEFDLVIPDGVKTIGAEAFGYCDQLTSVVIPHTVNVVGEEAFQHCWNLVSVEIKGGGTKFGKEAFQDCSKLTSVTLPEGMKTIWNSMFEGCSEASITIPASVTTIEGWALSGVKEIAVASGSASFKVVNGLLLSKDGTRLVQCPGSASGDLEIPSGVTAIESWAFCDYPATGEIRCAAENAKFCVRDGALLTKDGKRLISAAKRISGAYAVPNGVTKIDGAAFYGQDGMTSVSFPNGLVVINEESFEECTGLTSVTLPASVTQIGDEAFGNCSSLETVTIKASRVSIDEDAFHKSYNLKEVRVPWNFTGTIKGIPDGCKIVKVGLRELALKQTANSVGMKSLTGAGYYAEGKAATLRATTAVGYAFAGWYQDEDGVTPCEFGATDYRSPTASWTMPEGESDVPVTLYAKFVSAAADAESLAAHLSGETFTVDGAWTKALDVESGSLPTVKVTGLPKGLSFNAKTLTISGCPTTPGTYSVTVTLSNTSIKNKTEKFTIVVPNITSDRISGLWDKESADTPYAYTVGVVKPVGSLVVSADDGYSLKATGLPTGLKLDAKTGEVTGTPTKAGTYTVTFTATKGRSTETTTRTFVVSELPAKVVGTFSGFLRDAGDQVVGTFTMTATSAGKITAKVVDATGTYSFTGAWGSDSGSDRYVADMSARNGATLGVGVSLGAPWNENALSGSFRKDVALTISAQKSLFADKWYLAAESDGEGGWSLTLAETAAEAALTLTPKGDGTVTLAGKLGTYSVSGSTTLSFNEIADGVLKADFVPFVTVGKTKKALSISCSLDLNRTVGASAGTARLVD